MLCCVTQLFSIAFNGSSTGAWHFYDHRELKNLLSSISHFTQPFNHSAGGAGQLPYLFNTMTEC